MYFATSNGQLPLLPCPQEDNGRPLSVSVLETDVGKNGVINELRIEIPEDWIVGEGGAVVALAYAHGSGRALWELAKRTGLPIGALAAAIAFDLIRTGRNAYAQGYGSATQSNPQAAKMIDSRFRSNEQALGLLGTGLAARNLAKTVTNPEVQLLASRGFSNKPSGYIDKASGKLWIAGPMRRSSIMTREE